MVGGAATVSQRASVAIRVLSRKNNVLRQVISL